MSKRANKISYQEENPNEVIIHVYDERVCNRVVHSRQDVMESLKANQITHSVQGLLCMLPNQLWVPCDNIDLLSTIAMIYVCPINRRLNIEEDGKPVKVIKLASMHCHTFAESCTFGKNIGTHFQLPTEKAAPSTISINLNFNKWYEGGFAGGLSYYEASTRFTCEVYRIENEYKLKRELIFDAADHDLSRIQPRALKYLADMAKRTPIFHHWCAQCGQLDVRCMCDIGLLSD
jgi:hypothetical protein